MSKSTASHWSLAGALSLGSLLNLILPLALVRVITPEEFGHYKLIFLVVAVAPWALLSAGFNNGLYFWVGQPIATRKKAFVATFALHARWATIVMGAGHLLALIPLALYSSEWGLWVSLVSTAVALSGPATFFEEACTASGNVSQAGIFTVAFDVLRCGLMLFAAFVWQTALAILIAFVASVIVKLAVGLFLAHRREWIGKPLFQTAEELSPALDYAWPSSLAAFCTVGLNYADQFILGLKLTATEFATYTLGCLSIPPLFIFEQSVNKLLISKISADLQDGDLSAAQRRYQKAIADLGFVLIPSAVGLFVFADIIIEILFTQAYAEASTVLRVYSAWYLLFILPYDAFARARGDSKWVLRITSRFSILSLVSVLTGVFVAGVSGALVGFIGTQFMMRLSSIHATAQSLKTPVNELIPWRMLILFLFSACLSGGASWITFLCFTSGWLAFIVAGVVFGLCYLMMTIPKLLGFHRLGTQPNPHVLLLTQFLNVGGLERSVLNISRSLKNWKCDVFFYDSIPNATDLRAQFSAPVHHFDKGPGVSLRLVKALVVQCRSKGISLIHAHDLGPLIYAVLAKVLSFGAIRVMYTQHTPLLFSGNIKHKFLLRVFLYFADGVTVVSKPLQRLFEDHGYSANKVAVIENGVSFVERTESVEQRLALRENLLPKTLVSPTETKQFELLRSVWVVSLARLHRGKGQMELTKIWALLPEDIQKHGRLVFVGPVTDPGYASEVQDWIKSHDVTGVVFAGETLEPEVWLQAADVFVSGSADEGLPLAPIEAIGSGLECLLSDIPAHRALGDSAHFFKPDNTSNSAPVFSSTIEKYRGIYNTSPPPAGFQKMSSVPRGEVRERFGVERMAEQYAAMYRRIIES